MRSPLPRSRDRDYCRRVLPRVSRTFAINIRLLAPDLRDVVGVAYLLCRMCDALEDSWPGTADEIRARFGLFRAAVSGSKDAAERLAHDAAAIAGTRVDLSLVANAPAIFRAFAAIDADDRAAITECLTTMSEGMCRYSSRAAGRDAHAPYLETEAELHDYCFVVAGCVGRMLTRVFEHRHPDPSAERREMRLALAPTVGEALQLTNIILDWPVDLRGGRCYVPGEWLRELNLTPADLVSGPKAGAGIKLEAMSGSAVALERKSGVAVPPEPKPGAAIVLERLEAKARRALARVPDYLDLIPARALRFRLFCLWPALWAAASLDNAHRDPAFPYGERRPRLPRSRLWTVALTSLLVAQHGPSLRRWCFRGGDAREATATDKN
jgi:farnesyl-diphosphate farnesyltransferase